MQKACNYFEAVHQADICIAITGGNRCKAHNTAIGGADSSQHILGKAADHKFYDRDTGVHIKPQEVYDYYDSLYPDKFGIGIYSNRVHLDVRSGKARWDKR